MVVVVVVDEGVEGLLNKLILKTSRRDRIRNIVEFLRKEEETVVHTDKGKGKAPESSVERKRVLAPPRRSTGDPVIRKKGVCERESRSKHATEKQTQSQKAFSSRTCLTERYVNYNELIREVPDFGHLLHRAPIEPVERIPARAAFCVELIRELYYMRGKLLAEDQETGTHLFETFVHKTRIHVTPHTIGEILGLHIDTSGLHYTSSTYQ